MTQACTIPNNNNNSNKTSSVILDMNERESLRKWSWKGRLGRESEGLVGHYKVLALYFGQEKYILENMCYLEWTLNDEEGVVVVY